MDEALGSVPSLSLHRDRLINDFVQTLEKDASWVQLYDITGELVVPDLLDRAADRDAEARILTAQVRRISLLHCAF